MTEEDDGRQRRLWIIIAIGASVLLIYFAIDTVSERQANSHFNELRADLVASFQPTTVGDFLSSPSTPTPAP